MNIYRLLRSFAIPSLMLFCALPVAAQNEAALGLNVRFVDMNDQICPTASCAVMRNGVIVFTDDNHLTASFSRSVGGVLGDRVAAAAGLR